MKRKTSLVLTLNSASAEFGISKEKLRTALKAAGVDYGPGKTFTIKQVHCAFVGDFRHESTLLKRAKRKDAELELRRKEHELVSASAVKAIIADLFRPHREWITSQPGRLAALVNPSDPVVARLHLERDRDEYIRLKHLVTDEMLEQYDKEIK